MPLNAGYEYANAEKTYFRAVTLEQKISALQEMIRAAPKHKSSEHHVAELKNRLRRFIEKKEKAKKVGKTSVKGIRKEGFQCVLLGMTKSGKSSLLARLTNAKPITSDKPFTTKQPEVGSLDHKGFKIQIVDLPSIGSESFDIGIVNTSDLVLIVVVNFQELEKIEPLLNRVLGKKLIVFNKSDLLSDDEYRKLQERIRSKKLQAEIVSTLTKKGIEELKDRIVSNTELIRVYTKEPGKNSSNVPMVLPKNSTVKDVAESILKGFSSRIKETKITGPSSKFPNQKVGLGHVLKDLDIIEFHTK